MKLSSLHQTIFETHRHLSGRVSKHEPRLPKNKPTQGVSKYSLRFKFDDTLLAMAQVEGHAGGPYNDAAASTWLDKQYTDGPGTATGVLKKLKQMLKLHVGNAVDSDEGMSRVGTIEGLNGNRWSVYLNGMVILDSSRTPNTNTLRKAQQLQMDIE